MVWSKKSVIFWLGLVALHLLLRSTSFYTPILDIDETQFAGFAQALMDGGKPYLASLDTKPLGIYWFFQIIFEIFGPFNMIAVHVVTTLFYFVSALFLFKMGAKIFKSQRMGQFVALFFIIFTTTSVPKILSTSINSILIFWLILSAYYLFSYFNSKKILPLIASALFLGVGIIFKYNAGIQIFLFPLAWIVLSPYQYKEVFRLRFWTLQLLYGLVLCVPFAAHAVYLHHIGVLHEFVLWSLKGSGAYISQGSQTISFFKVFAIRAGAFVLISWLCFLGAYKAFKFHKKTQAFILAAIWAVLSFIPVCVGGRFYPHYFLQVIPPLCLLAAIGFQKLELKKWQWVLGLVLPACLFLVLRISPPLFYSYFPNMNLKQQQEVGQVMTSDPAIQKDHKLFVWGFATGIYFWSELKPASRFLWADLLCGRTPGPKYARSLRQKESAYSNPQAWSRFWQDMQQNQPEWFVDTSPASIMQYQYFPISQHPKLAAWLKEHYEPYRTIQDVKIYKRRGQ